MGAFLIGHPSCPSPQVTCILHRQAALAAQQMYYSHWRTRGVEPMALLNFTQPCSAKENQMVLPPADYACPAQAGSSSCPADAVQASFTPRGNMPALACSVKVDPLLTCPLQVMRVLPRHTAQQELPAALCRPPQEPSASPLSAAMLSEHLAVQDLQTPRVAPAG